MPATNRDHASERGREREALNRIYLSMADALLAALERPWPHERPARGRALRGTAPFGAPAAAAPRRAGKAVLL